MPAFRRPRRQRLLGKNVTDRISPQARKQFRRLIGGQLLAGLALGAAALAAFGPEVALAALWGGVICLLGHAWGGFQVWLHPRNRYPERMAGAAVRAELGKLVIIISLLWLTFSQYEVMRGREMAAALLAGFFLVQVAGWVVLATAGGTGDNSGERNG